MPFAETSYVYLPMVGSAAKTIPKA
jgi:hypothetical protein